MIKTITKKHQEKINTHIYVTLAGEDLTLRNLLDMKCPNFVAAKRLEKNLKKLKVKSVSELHKIDPFSLFNMRGIGVSQIFVAECIIFKYHDGNPYNWYKKHLNPRKKRGHEV